MSSNNIWKDDPRFLEVLEGLQEVYEIAADNEYL